MNAKLLEILQSVRDEVGFAFTINSAYRCKKHNFEVGGSPNSQHLLGKAVDVSTNGLSGEQKHRLLKVAFSKGFAGVGVYSNFFHLDVRDEEVFFTKI
jgi:uncharacterized protein YcbK (DUF882 family)